METFLFTVFVIMLVTMTLIGLAMMFVLLFVMVVAARTMWRIVNAEFPTKSHNPRAGSNPPLNGSVRRPTVPPSPPHATSVEL